MQSANTSRRTGLEDLVALLGGEQILERPITSEIDVSLTVARGIAVASLEHLAAHFDAQGVPPSSIYEVVGNARTLLHRKRQRTRLSRAESDRLTRIARIAVLAGHALGSLIEGMRWLGAPNRDLDGRRPLTLLATDPGTAFVEAMLDRMDLRALLLLKGRTEVLAALEASGGMWSAEEAQQHLQLGRASLESCRRGKGILALPLPDNSFGYPRAQVGPSESDRLPPRPYPAMEAILRFVGDRLSAEEIFLLLATPQDALAENDANEWRTGFQFLAAGEAALVMAFVEHVTGQSDDGAPRVSPA